MTRFLSSTVTAYVTGTELYPVFLAQFQFDSGRLNLWTGYRTLVFDTGEGSEGFAGAGDLGKVSPVMETERIRATGLDFSLSGLNSAVVSIALGEDYQGRICILWLGFMDTNGDLAGSVELFRGRMDILSISESGETSTISVKAESVLVALEKSYERRWTDNDQKIDYPSDEGFSGVAALQQREINWGG
jgi:hypothetical protein